MGIATLRCEGLVKSFDGVRALDHVALSLPVSGIVAIIGPNGAGKTTLLNVLTGHLRPDAGRVYLGDRDISRAVPHRIARSGVARTFQDLRLIGQISVLDNVMLARQDQRGERLFGALFRFGVATEEAENHQEALRWLQLVGLAEQATDLAGEISYGQQKLLTLACSLATEARILLIDEPVAGVHPDLAVRILELLRWLSGEGKLVVFIEHDLAAVREVANRVIVMDDGRVIADGAPADILTRPEIMEAYIA